MLALRFATALVLVATVAGGCRKHPEPPDVLTPGEKGPCCPVADPRTWDPQPVYYTHDEPVFTQTGQGLGVTCKVGMRFRMTDDGCFKSAIALVDEWRGQHEDLTQADLELQFAAAAAVDGVNPGDPMGRVVWRERDEELDSIHGQTLRDGRGYAFIPPGAVATTGQ